MIKPNDFAIKKLLEVILDSYSVQLMRRNVYQLIIPAQRLPKKCGEYKMLIFIASTSYGPYNYQHYFSILI